MDSPLVAKLKDALAKRLAATSELEKREAEDEIATILRGRPASRQFDGRQAQTGERD